MCGVVMSVMDGTVENTETIDGSLAAVNIVLRVGDCFCSEKREQKSLQVEES